MLRVGQQIYRINETYYNTDTKAMIQYKLGNLASARLYAVRSLQLCKARNVPRKVIEETQALLNKIIEAERDIHVRS